MPTVTIVSASGRTRSDYDLPPRLIRRLKRAGKALEEARVLIREQNDAKAQLVFNDVAEAILTESNAITGGRRVS